MKFDGVNFLELFVGQNGAGKSNLFEALIVVFLHIYEAKVKNKKDIIPPSFEYKLSYIINGDAVEWTFNGETLTNESSRNIDLTFPDNILVYYSGQNSTVSNLLRTYEAGYLRTIDSADIDESRIFLGIGPEYKQLLLALLVLLPEANKAREYAFRKLGLHKKQDMISIILQRPKKNYAKGVVVDDFDPRTHYWGLKGQPKEFVDRLQACIKGEFSHRAIYSSAQNKYTLNIDVGLFRREFGETDSASLFSSFDNLKALDMLVEINAELAFENSGKIDLGLFSDGQYQSIYIYALSEIFKHKNSLTLLDEPDSFLHPEWQFEFVNQVENISGTAVTTNQVLMSSHSAITLMAYTAPYLRSIKKSGNGHTEVVLTPKSEVIKALSGGKVYLDENQTIMSISTFLKNTNQPVLFTEGISDEYIFDVAWKKLYGDEIRPFCIHHAFDRQFLRNLMSRDDLQRNYPSRLFFAIFDFDDAFDDWNGISLPSKKGVDIESNPFNGLMRQLKVGGDLTDKYVMLLPVPNVDEIKKQVLKQDGTPWGRGADSHMAIEMLFYQPDLLGHYFNKEQVSCGGERIVFCGDKVNFAQSFIPSLSQDKFEVFRPLFENMKTKITV